MKNRLFITVALFTSLSWVPLFAQQAAQVTPQQLNNMPPAARQILNNPYFTGSFKVPSTQQQELTPKSPEEISLAQRLREHSGGRIYLYLYYPTSLSSNKDVADALRLADYLTIMYPNDFGVKIYKSGPPGRSPSIESTLGFTVKNYFDVTYERNAATAAQNGVKSIPAAQLSYKGQFWTIPFKKLPKIAMKFMFQKVNHKPY